MLVPHLDFRILGPLEVWFDDVRLRLTSPKLRTVLAALLVRNGALVTTDAIVDAVWGHDAPEAAVRTLRTYVSKLRAALDDGAPGAGETVVTEPGGYRLTAAPQQVDAGRFEAAWTAARRMLELAPAEAATMLQSALALWRGPALSDFAFEEFAQPEIQRLEELRLTVVTARIGAELSSSDGAGLVGELEALVATHPTHERLWAYLMVALHREGRTREALHAYERARSALADAGLSPSDILSSTQAKVLADDPSLRGPTEVGDTELPAPPAVVVGREQEISATVSALASRRLVTLLGTGGVGKTTVALSAAHRIAGSRLVVWADLAVLVDSRQVASLVAGLFGLSEQPGRPLGDLLRRHLGARPAVLVLDNCEHLLPDLAPVVSRLVASCPSLTVLATSRSALRIADERVLAVSPLHVPETAEALEFTGSAVELLERRIADLGGQPATTEDDRRAFVQICRILDGLPLAIELAAPRMRVLSADELAARLANQNRMLVSDRRDAVARQLSLDATLRWSYDLLDDDERLLLDRLSIFAGAFGLDAAQRVCGFGTNSSDGVIEVLGELVSKSLVVHRVVAGRGSFRLLETVREWARHRLRERAEFELLADRLSEHCQARLDDAANGPESVDVFRAIEADILQSLEHLIATGQYTAAATLLESSIAGFEAIGRGIEYDRFVARLLPHVDEMEPLARAQVLSDAAMDPMVPERDRCVQLLRMAVDAFEVAGACPAEAHNQLGIRHLVSGEWDAAVAQFQRAIDEATEQRSIERRWIVRSNLAVALARLDRFDEAHDQLQLCAAEASMEGWTAVPGVALCHATIARRSGDLAGARAVLLTRAAELRDGHSAWTLDDAWVHGELAGVELELGDVESARVHDLRALRLYTTVYGMSLACRALAVAAAVAEAGGQWQLAAQIEGGVSAWMTRADYVLDPGWLNDIVDRPMAEARSPLDPVAFAGGWASGVGRHPIELAERVLDAMDVEPISSPG